MLGDGCVVVPEGVIGIVCPVIGFVNVPGVGPPPEGIIPDNGLGITGGAGVPDDGGTTGLPAPTPGAAPGVAIVALFGIVGICVGSMI